VQSLIRRHAARNKAAIMRHERDTAAATILQAKYRSFHATKTYKSVMRKIIAIQCFVRQFIALRMLNKLKEERRILEDEMTTKIATTWRRHHYQCVYKRAVENVIICQSIVRRHAAIEELNLLKFQRDTAVATLIETEVRAYIARKHYKQMRSSTILLQSLVRQMIAYNELEELRYEKMMLEEYCATRIAAVWRSYYTRTGYIIVLKGMHAV
jgi:myosin heavy subunit